MSELVVGHCVPLTADEFAIARERQFYALLDENELLRATAIDLQAQLDDPIALRRRLDAIESRLK